MYTRDFNVDESQLGIPKNYSGTALFSEDTEVGVRAAPQLDQESEPVSKMVENKEKAPSWFEKIRHFLPFGQLSERLSLPTHLGSEELIILALVAFLIFTKNFDVECIIMLVALLFI